MRYDNAVKLSHILLDGYIKPGMTAVDMTAGNGLDSIFMLERLGDSGFLYAFDIQARAIENTGKILADIPKNKYMLINDSHIRCREYINEGTADVIIFNLGYLPGGNKKIITEYHTTITAVSMSLGLLKTGGIIVIVSYTGHDNGLEHGKIAEYVGLLDQKEYNVLVLCFPNQKNDPSKLILIEKKRRNHDF